MKPKQILTIVLIVAAEGNVISTNATRPSSEDIRRLLDANL